MRGNILKHTFMDRQDEATGKTVRQLTSLTGNHHHLYFTSSSFTRGNLSVLYISDTGSGHPNVFKLSLETGQAIQLTDNTEGIMKSYVYYDGNPYRGLGKASPSYNPQSNQMLYIQGSEVRLLDVDSLEEQVIYVLPDQVMTGFTHLSTDGRYACVPYITAEAFEVEEGNPFPRILSKIERKGIHSQVLVIDTKTGKGEIKFTHHGWITHVQFHPHDPEQILFNHEGGMVIQRIWLYRDGEIHKIRDQSQTDRNTFWICHEMWLNGGNGVIYHGARGLPNDPAMKHAAVQSKTINFVGCQFEGQEPVEFEFPAGMTAYGHFTSGTKDDILVTDGIMDPKEIHICRTDWLNNRIAWERLCRHNSSFSVQDVHPHPIFSHDDKNILFSSDAHNEPTQGHLYIVKI